MIELIVSLLIGVLFSVLIYYYARSSLKFSDNIDINSSEPTKENTKKKSNNQKTKTKAVKSDTKSKKKALKSKKEQDEISEFLVKRTLLRKANDVPEAINNVLNESAKTETSITEWKEVSKPNKKINKKSSNVRVTEDEVITVPKIEPKVIKKEEAVAKPVVPNKKSEPKSVEVKVGSTIEQNKENLAEKKEVNVAKVQNLSKENELNIKVNELLMENEKLKFNSKETTKLIANQTVSLTKELEVLKSKLAISSATEDKLNEELQRRTTSINDMKNQFQIVQKELTKNIVTGQSIKNEKTQLEKKIIDLEHLNHQLNEKLTKDNFDQDLMINKMKAETSLLMKQRENELNQQIHCLSQEKQQLNEQLCDMKKSKDDLIYQCQNLQSELKHLEKSTEDLNKENSELHRLKEEMQTEIDNLKKSQSVNELSTQESVQLKEAIAQLNKDKSCLEEENKNLKKHIHTAEEQTQLSNNVQLSQFQQKLEELQNLLDEKTKQYDDLKQQSEINSENLKQQSETSSENLNKLQLTITDLENQLKEKSQLVDSYKSGLENTEDILSKLQKSVNEEEEKWRDSLMKSETEAEKSKKELERAFSDLLRIKSSKSDKNELNFAYHCVDKSLSTLIDEMESEMKRLETSLENVIQERDEALTQAKYTKSETKVLNGDNYHNQNNNNNIDNNNTNNDVDLDKLRNELAEAIDKNQYLQNQVNKYQSLVKIGHDTLNAEKMKFEQWKQQIHSYEASNTDIQINDNSTSINNNGISHHQNSDQNMESQLS